MKNIDNIIEEFEIEDTSVLDSCDVHIDLKSKWFNTDSYKIDINGLIREIEMVKVSINELILFVDTIHKQITVLSLDNNIGGTKYKYEEIGKVVCSVQNGINKCSVVSFKHSDKVVFSLDVKNKEPITKDFPYNDNGIAEAKSLFDKYFLQV